MKRLLSACIALNLFTSVAIGSEDPVKVQKATKVNAISSEFLQSKLQNDGIKNSMVSSVSLYYALAILQNGAAGITKETITSALLNANGDVNAASKALAALITSSRDEGDDASGMFQLANSIWATNGASNNEPFVFNKDFIAASKANYKAEAQSLDFKAQGASKALNTWASEKTNGLIPEIIDDATLAELEWAIMNAAYFEGTWAAPTFKVSKEHGNFSFKNLDSEELKVDSISTSLTTNVLDYEDGSVAFSLPFAGRKYSLVVYLPAEVAKEDWLLNESANALNDSIEAVLAEKSWRVSVQLPTFSFSDGVKMLAGSPIAQDLGILPLFSNNNDFSPMVDLEKTSEENASTKVGLIKQNTRIELDEKGVKAAAVTLIGGVRTTSVNPIQPRPIVVDRPFLFAIVETATQTVLFNGLVVDPTAK
jgi:serine protease inhibitor